MNGIIINGKRTITVVVAEEKSPYSPSYKDPLLFTVELEGEAAYLVDDEATEKAILDNVAYQRALDFGDDDNGEVSEETLEEIRDGLRIMLVFEGDISPVLDWRTS